MVLLLAFFARQAGASRSSASVVKIVSTAYKEATIVEKPAIIRMPLMISVTYGI